MVREFSAPKETLLLLQCSAASKANNSIAYWVEFGKKSQCSSLPAPRALKIPCFQRESSFRGTQTCKFARQSFRGTRESSRNNERVVPEEYWERCACAPRLYDRVIYEKKKKNASHTRKVAEFRALIIEKARTMCHTAKRPV